EHYISDDAGDEPVWSPDGSTIAFDYAGGIWATPYQGAEPTQLSADGASPNWSPDGSRIAFSRSSSQSGFGSELWGLNADGGSKTAAPLTPLNPAGTPSDGDPAWSPDGSKIVFTRADNSQTDLYTMNANGTGQTNITNSPSVSERSPDWQPLST